MHKPRLSRRAIAAWAALGGAAGLGSAAAGWGFVVDDALITARYAHNLATGLGYRLSPGAAVSDGVTPLGLAHLL